MLHEKFATCLLLSVPPMVVMSAWMTFSDSGAPQFPDWVSLVVLSVLIGFLLFATPFWRVRQAKHARILMLGASFLAALSVGLRPTIDGELARSLGFFAQSQSWSSKAALPPTGQRFRHPSAGYTMTLPQGWVRHEEPTGHTSFRLEDDSGIVAELLPSCWNELDLASFVAPFLRDSRALDGTRQEWRCTMFAGYEACRLERISTDEHGVELRWFTLKLQLPRAEHGVALIYRAKTSHDTDEFIGIAASVTGAEHMPASPCVIPTRWAQF